MKSHLTSEAVPLSLLINTFNAFVTVFKGTKANHSWEQNTTQETTCHI